MKTVLKTLAIASLFIGSSVAAQAQNEYNPYQSIRGDVGIYTDHFNGAYDDNGNKYNESNEFVAVQYQLDRWLFNSSSFVNSFNVDSYTIGGGYRIYDGSSVYFDLQAGYVKGYDDKNVIEKPFSVYVAPEIGYKFIQTNSFNGIVNARLLGEAVIISLAIEFKL